MIKKIIVAIMVAIPMLVSAQTIKIGYVDAQAIMNELPAYKEAQTQFEAIGKKYDEEYKAMMAEAQKKFEEFQAMQNDTSVLDSVKQRRAQELDEMSQKLSAFEQQAQQELNKKQQELMQPIVANVQQAIQSVGKDGAYTMIQETAAALYWGAPAEDITPQVKARLGIK